MSRRAALRAVGAALAAGALQACGGGGDGSSSGATSSPTLAGRWRIVSTPIGGFVNASFTFTPEGSLSGTEANGSFSGTWSPLFPGANQFKVRLVYVDARVPNAPVTTDYTVSVSNDDPPHAFFFGTLIELISLGPP